MAKKRRDRSDRGHREAARARRLRRFSVGCGLLTALAFVLLVAGQLVRSGRGEHAHPPGPHGGKLVVLGRGDAHYHAELLVEPSGVVRLYTLGNDASEAVAAEPQLLMAKARPAGAEGEQDLVFRPVAGPGGSATEFLGRIPSEAVAARVQVRVAGLKIRGEAFDFAVSWESGRTDAEVRAAYEADQRKLYLTAGEKYTAADIAATGRTTAAAKYRGHPPAHGDPARPGERVCPVTGLKAAEVLVWWIGGEQYLFCCQPCIDEFVSLAKDRPAEVRPPATYVRR